MKQTQLFRDEEILLGDLCQIEIGKTPSRKNLDNFGEDYIWVSIGDMNEKYIEDSKEKLTTRGVKESNARLIPAGTLLLSFKLSLGKVAITKKPLYTNEAIAALIPKRRINIEYLYYYLKQVDFSVYARKAVKGLCLNKRILAKIKIKLVPIETQDKIVSILEKAEQLKQWREESDKLTDDYLNSCFLKVFGDPIKNPKNWEKVPLGKLSRIRRGASPRPIKDFLGGTVPWIKIGDGTKGNELYIEETEEKIIEEGVHKSVFLKKGALIFANCGVSLGFARILKIDGCIHDGWLSLEEIDQRLNKIFLLKLVNYISDYFRRLAPKGTQPNLNTLIIKKFEIPLPPITLQNKFANIVKEFQQIKDLQNQSKKQVEDLLNVLTQKAFRGELAC